MGRPRNTRKCSCNKHEIWTANEHDECFRVMNVIKERKNRRVIDEMRQKGHLKATSNLVCTGCYDYQKSSMKSIQVKTTCTTNSMMESPKRERTDSKLCGICSKRCEFYYDLEADKYDCATYLGCIGFDCSAGSIVCDSCYPKMLFLYNLEWACAWLREERDNLVSWFANKRLENTCETDTGNATHNRIYGNAPFDIKKLSDLLCQTGTTYIDIGVQVDTLDIEEDTDVMFQRVAVKQEISDNLYTCNEDDPLNNLVGFDTNMTNEFLCDDTSNSTDNTTTFEPGIDQQSYAKPNCTVTKYEGNAAIAVSQPVEKNISLHSSYDFSYLETTPEQTYDMSANDDTNQTSSLVLKQSENIQSAHFDTDAAAIEQLSNYNPSHNSAACVKICSKYHKKKYGCVSCHLRFNTNAKRDFHIKTAHDMTKPFCCPYCKRRFANENTWRGHMKKLHKWTLLEMKSYSANIVNSTTDKQVQRDVISSPSDLVKPENTDSSPIDYDAVAQYESSRNGNQHTSTAACVKISPRYHDKRYPCFYCPLRFDKRSKREQHIKTAHDVTKPFCCPYCKRRWIAKRSWREHMKKSHNWTRADIRNACNTNAVNNAVNEPKYSCEQCKEPFGDSRELEEHMQAAHDPNKPYCCEVCKRRFPSKPRLNDHMALHAEIHKCPTCGKCFTQRGRLERHYTIHTGMKPHVCDLCGNSFTNITARNYHIKTQHPGQDIQPIPRLKSTKLCTICGKYCGKESFRLHLARHRKAKSHKCPKCGRYFASATGVTIHLQSLYHTIAKPYKCSHCGKRFHNKYVLARHQRHAHSSPKLHTCPTCGKSYKQKHNLVEHQRDHTGAPLFRCSYCSMQFTRSSALKRHFKHIHKGERPGENHNHCTICSESFISPNFLEYHMSRQHNITPE